MLMPLFHASPWPVRVADVAGNILLCNSAYDRNIKDGAWDEDMPDIVEIAQQLEYLHKKLELPSILRHKGESIFYRSEHHLLTLGKNFVPLVVSHFFNITAEEHAKSRTLAMQSRLDDLIKLTSDWVWETDGDLRLTATSPHIMEQLGFHPREIMGCHIFKLGTAQSSDIDPITQLPMVVQRLTPFRNMAFAITDRKGAQHHYLFSGMPVFDRGGGKFLGYRGTARDITAELAAKHKADMFERRLSHTIENMSEGFCLFDHDGKLILANSVMRDFYPKTHHLLKPGMDKISWRRQTIISHDIDIGDIAADDWVEKRLHKWRSGGSSMEIKLGDGRYILVRDYKTDDGGTVSISTDISEIKQRESELIEARNIADKASRTKGEFFAKMSHELRTPLNAIIGFSDIMQGEKLGGLGAPQYKTYAHDIHDSASHLLNIINDILDVSKAEAGKLELFEQNVSVISAVQSTIRMLSERAQKSGITIDAAGVDPNLVLRADQKKMRQILINLLSNAVKFTLRGGTITITANLDANQNAIIKVVDSGIGMRPEDIPRALTPFAQVDNAITRQHDGTGLGLPLCVALAELHGGRLHIDSTPGVGTTIYIWLPAYRVITAQKIR